MERILPYEISYKCLEKWRFVENGFLWSLLLCPFLTVLLQKQNNEFVVRCINILSIINYISIIGYALLYIIVEILMQPIMLQVVTEKRDNHKMLTQLINERFDFRPEAIIERLGLRQFSFLPTSRYGHFSNSDYPWEQVYTL